MSGRAVIRLWPGPPPPCSPSEQQLFHAVSQVYRPDPRFDLPPHGAVVREACWKEEALAIGYGDKGGATTSRTILPLAMIYTERSLTVLAWCCLRDAFRMFNLARIHEVTRLPAGFRPRRAALLRDYIARLTDEESAEPRTGNRP